MRTKIVILLLALPLILLSQNLLDMPESVTYDSAQSRYLVTNVGSGDIIAIDDQGVQSTFVTGQSKRGILLKDDFVYTAGDAGLTCFDLAGSQIWQTSLPGAIFLNDVAADNSGYLYVSDYPQDYGIAPDPFSCRTVLRSCRYSNYMPIRLYEVKYRFR